MFVFVAVAVAVAVVVVGGGGGGWWWWVVVGGGCSLFVVRWWVLGVGCWLFVVRCSVFGVRCWLMVDGWCVLGVGCWVLVVGYWVLGVGCWFLLFLFLFLFLLLLLVVVVLVLVSVSVSVSVRVGVLVCWCWCCCCCCCCRRYRFNVSTFSCARSYHIIHLWLVTKKICTTRKSSNPSIMHCLQMKQTLDGVRSKTYKTRCNWKKSGSKCQWLGSTWGYGSVHPGQLQCSPNNSYPYGCSPQTNGTNVPQVKIDTPPLRCCFFIISWCSNLKVVEACRSYSAKIFLDPSWSQQWKVDFGPPSSTAFCWCPSVSEATWDCSRWKIHYHQPTCCDWGGHNNYQIWGYDAQGMWDMWDTKPLSTYPSPNLPVRTHKCHIDACTRIHVSISLSLHIVNYNLLLYLLSHKRRMAIHRGSWNSF